MADLSTNSPTPQTNDPSDTTYLGKILIELTDGIKCSILGEDNYLYDVSFYNDKNNSLIYRTTLKSNCWAKPTLKYFIPWRIEIETDNPKLKKFTWKLDLTGKNVQIDFLSSSLGDSLAWIPYVEAFRKKHNCNIYCSTFKNFLYQEAYPEINFIQPGESGLNIFGRYNIGWFYADGRPDFNTIPIDFRKNSLQSTAASILGIPNSELQAKLSLKKGNVSLPEKKYVTFSVHSTAQAKYWNNPTGWQSVVDWLKEKNITPVCVDQFDSFGGQGKFNQIPSNCEKRLGLNLDNVAELIKNAELHIGISSGLSWLAWALQKQTVVISGFSEPVTEFKNNSVRISTPNGKCSGCFNNYSIQQDDWMWCPVHKGTSNEFECSTSIPANTVIAELEKLLIKSQ